MAFLRTLKASRDMTVNEAKLVIAIEDPRARERRQLGIEVRALVCAFLAAGHATTTPHNDVQ